MAEYTGRVQTITEEAGKGKNPPHRPFVKFSVKLNGNYYGCFLDNKNESMLRAVSEHDEVVITTKVNGKFENLDTIRVISKKEAEPVKSTVVNAAALGNSAAVPPATRPVDAVREAVGRLDSKDFRITYQACSKIAMPLVQYLIDKGILPIGTGKEKQADNVYAYLRRYTLALAHDAWNVRPEDAKTLSAEEMDSKKAPEQKMEE